MTEFIKHALGLCGESHPNIFHIVLSWSAIIGVLTYVGNRLKNKIWK